MFFAENDKLILKFICKHKDPKINKTTWKKKNKPGKLILSNFEANCINLQSYKILLAIENLCGKLSQYDVQSTIKKEKMNKLDFINILKVYS